MLQRVAGLTAWLVVVVLAAGGAYAAEQRAPARRVDPAAARAAALFPVPAEIRPAVAFWTDIYARYSTEQTVLHDQERLDVVYGVLDFAELGRTPLSEWQRASTRTNSEELEKERIRNLLRDIALNADRPERLTPEQRRIHALFPPDDNGFRVTGARFLDAADRVRGQVGQRDRFIDGLRTGGRYLPEIERIFEQEGVPVELTRLPFVESMFNLGARSSVGASGIWQFMRSTGRMYLRVDDLVDERNDPLLAARGAARLLADNFADLKAWPLAITAYNHGKYGMLRAVNQTGSRDIGTIVREYRGPAFGFASRNFYAEFLAALHVERNARRYFGPLKSDAPPQYDLVAMPGHMTISDLARRAGVEADHIYALNPGLTQRALRGSRPMPKGYALRVPASSRPRLVQAKLTVRPGWRPPVVAAVGRPASPADVRPAVGGPGGTPIPSADQLDRLTPAADAPRLDPELYRAQLMAQEEEALALFLAGPADVATDEPAVASAPAGAASAAAPAGPAAPADTRVAAVPPTGEPAIPDMASPPEASGDRLLDAAVEALEASQPAEPASGALAAAPDDKVRPGGRVVPSVATSGQLFRVTVRGGETAWRLAEWSDEPLDAFRARNRLAADQPLPAGRTVSVSSATVPRDAFDARRAAYHEALRERAAREFAVTGTRPHRVLPGETPWRLAETHGVPYWLLEQTNPDRDLSAVRAGDTLLLPVLKRP
jgi:membrane-bound lytic murein transglycosylase D